LLELILPKITEPHQLPPSLKLRRLNRRRQGKGVKACPHCYAKRCRRGEKELPPPPLLARPASRQRRTGAGLALCRSRLHPACGGISAGRQSSAFATFGLPEKFSPVLFFFFYLLHLFFPTETDINN